MTYASLMVPVDLGPTAADRIRLAASLAKIFDADLMGVAARQTDYTIYGSGRAIGQNLLNSDEDDTFEALKNARALFDREAGFKPGVSWRSAIAPPLRFILRHARAADLVVISRQGVRDGNPGEFAISTASLLMELGRPVLIAPPNVDRLRLERVVIAWKDTGEARRAVLDALPLLRRAGGVYVVAIESGSFDDSLRESVGDVADYLTKHGIKATSQVVKTGSDGVTDDLLNFVRQTDADLIVSGAYGHSRMSEWVFGGVTHDLLQTMPVCCFMSH